MNIIEALKSGLRFKRAIHANWLNVHRTEPIMEDDIDLVGSIYEFESLDDVYLREEDILADDWQTYQEKRELSWEEIEEVMLKYWYLKEPFSKWGPEIKQELGFS